MARTGVYARFYRGVYVKSREVPPRNLVSEDLALVIIIGERTHLVLNQSSGFNPGIAPKSLLSEAVWISLIMVLV